MRWASNRANFVAEFLANKFLHRHQQHQHTHTMAIVTRQSSPESDSEYVSLISPDHSNDKACKNRFLPRDSGEQAFHDKDTTCKTPHPETKAKKTRSVAPFHKRLVFILGLIAAIVVLKSTLFSSRTFNFTNKIDDYARSIWQWAEDTGRIEKYPGYKVEFKDEFPEFQVLEDNWKIIQKEAEQLLLKRHNIPRLYDLVEKERAKSKVYKADWKVFWLKMGFDIPENQARAPETSRLLKKIPTLTNAFFSVIEPGNTVDAHWGHWGGFLRYHLGLIVPHNNANEDIYLRIRPDIAKDNDMPLDKRNRLLDQGSKYFWKEGEGVMFDDNPLHDATNQSDGTRVVLFLDVKRRPINWYMQIFNNIAVFASNRMEPLVSMRKKAVIDESKVLSKPGRRLSEERALQQLDAFERNIGE